MKVLLTLGLASIFCSFGGSFVSAAQGGIAPPPPPPGSNSVGTNSTGPAQSSPAPVAPKIGPVGPQIGPQAPNGLPPGLVNPGQRPGGSIFDGGTAPISLKPQTATRPASGQEPKMTYDKIDFEFGEVDEGKTYDSIVHFSNDGNGPLTIANGEPGCGCTKLFIEVEGRPYLYGDPIPVGRKGTILARVDTEGFGGQDKRTGAKLYTNDPAFNDPASGFGVLNLKIHLNIHKRFTTDPPGNVIIFETAPNTESSERLLLLKSTRKEPFQVIGFEPADALLEMRAEAADATASSWKIIATLAPGAPFGPFIKYVRILTKPQAPPFQITVQGNVVGPVAVDPMGLFFLTIPKGRAAVKLFTVRNTDPAHPMKLENIRFLDPQDNFSRTGGPAREHEGEIKKHIVVRPKVSEPNMYQVEVVIDETMPVGNFSTVLSIKTGVPGASMAGTDDIRIPITGYVK